MKEGCKAFVWDPKPKVIAASLLNLYSPALGVMGKFGLFLWAMPASASASASATEARSEVNTTYPPDKVKTGNNTIGINDIKMLEKIGRDKNFPTNGSYELTANIDAINFTKSIVFFQGDFNGKNHTISNLKVPLMWELSGGKIRNLTISNANITEHKGCLAAFACFVINNSEISHAQCKDSHMQDSPASYTIFAGMVASRILSSSRIENVFVKNCTMVMVRFSGEVGVLAGKMLGESSSSNNTVERWDD